MDRICKAICHMIDDMMEDGVTAQNALKLAELIRARQTILEYKPPPSESQGWDAGRVESEIQAAQVYYDKWMDTGEEIFNQMALDELKHAQNIIRHSSEISEEQIQKFNTKIRRLQTALQ